MLRLGYRTINGDKNRYKLRLRFYEDNPHAPVFFEIKRRMNDAIMKQRCGIKRIKFGWEPTGVSASRRSRSTRLRRVRING